MKDQDRNLLENTVSIPKKEYHQLLAVKEELAQLKRMIFGTKSERFVPKEGQEQLPLGLDDQKASESSEDLKEKISFTRRKKKRMNKAVRLELPAHLPRNEEVIEPQKVPQGSREIGREVTEVLEYTPGQMYVRKIVRPKYSAGEQQGVIIADLPSLPIPKGNAGAGVLAHILISKFTDHLPFYRQARQFRRQDIEISESTIGGWFATSCTLIAPLYETLKKKVLEGSYLMADESPIAVQDRNKKGKTHRGYHWVYYSPQQKLLCFDYRPTRARAGPLEFLKNFSGRLQTDGYSAYDKLEETHDIILHGCMAHARRKFEKARDNDRERAEHVLTRMQALYDVERIAREENLDPGQRKELRLQKSAPVLEDLEKWMKKEVTKVRPKSSMGKAIAYALGLWPRLTRYLEDGRVEIDNNLVENSIRPMAVGRKNYLFAGSHKAAQRAAIMYSLLGTCKKNDIEPFGWLRDTLEKLPDHPVNQLEELLPVKG